MTCTCDITISGPDADGKHYATCSTCGRHYRTLTLDASQHHPKCPIKCPEQGKASDMACVHRGELTRKELCPSCKGHVELNVFACNLHQCECVIAKAMPDVRTCDFCTDKKAVW